MILRPIDKIDNNVLGVLSKTWIWVVLFVLSLCAGVFVSLTCNNALWFSRFGSVATIAGLMLIMRKLFREGIYSESENGRLAELPITIPGRGTVLAFDEEKIKDGRASVLGVLFTVVGTVVWGFGDLLLKPLL